jgi:hypothetical protein
MTSVIERTPAHARVRKVLTQCGYHYGPDSEGCRLVQLRSVYLGRVMWDEPTWVCPDCREHLRGLFRYYRGPMTTTNLLGETVPIA